MPGKTSLPFMDHQVLKAVFETVTDAVAIVSPDRTIRFVNPAFETLFGYTADEIIGKSTSIFYADEGSFQETAANFLFVANQFDTETDRTEYDMTYRRADGTTFKSHTVGKVIRDAAGKFVAYVAIIRDTTEEAFVRQQIARLYELSIDMIAVADVRGRFITLSPSWKTVLGHSLDSLININAFDLIHPEDQGKVQEELGKATQSRLSALKFTARARTKTGTYKWLAWTCMPDWRHRVYYFIVRDVSEEEAARNRITAQKENLLALYEITSTPELSYEDQIFAFQALGRYRFELEHSILTRYRNEAFVITSSVSTDPRFKVGNRASEIASYCQTVHQVRDVVATHHYSKSPYFNAEAFEFVHCESFIGIPLFVDGEFYGALAFFGDAPCEKPFEDDRIDFARMLGQVVAATVAHEQAHATTSRIYELSGDLLAIVHESGVIQRASESWYSVLGYTPEEVVGHTVYEYMTPDTRDDLQTHEIDNIALLKTTRDTTFEALMEGKNGQMRWISWNVAFFPAEKLAYAIGRDITPIREAQAILRRRHDQLRALYEITSSPTFSVDEQIIVLLIAGCVFLDFQMGMVLETEDNQQKLVYSWGDLAPEVGERVSVPDDHDHLLEDIYILEEPHSAESCGLALSTPLTACVHVPININREPFGRLKFVSYEPRTRSLDQADHDFMRMIAQLVEVLMASKIHADQLQTIYELSTDLIALVNRDGYILRYSPSWEKNMGYTAHEILTRPAIRIIHPDDRRRVFNEILPSLNNPEARNVFKFEARLLTNDGQYRWVSWVALRNPTTELFSLIGRDITEYKALTAELLAANEEMEDRVQARTLQLQHAYEEIQSLAYIISHDLRTPMINIRGFLDEIKLSLDTMMPAFSNYMKSLPANDQQQVKMIVEEDIPQSMNFMNISVQNMDRMINGMLTLSRLGNRPLNFEHVELDRVIADERQNLTHAVTRNNITIKQGELPAVIGDQIAMRTIFGNLLRNAVQYLDADRPGNILVWSSETEKHYVIAVQDNGRGIDEKDFDRVFEIFRRVGRQDTTGEGMGLAYVQTLVRRHGGHIWFESLLGEGTTFYVSLRKTPGEGVDQ